MADATILNLGNKLDPEPILLPGGARAASVVEPQRKDGKITRDGMLAVVRNGGSVMFSRPDGSFLLIDHESKVPSEADFAVGDKEAEKAANANLDAQIAALQAQKDKLTAGSAGVAGPPKDAGSPPAARNLSDDPNEVARKKLAAEAAAAPVVGPKK